MYKIYYWSPAMMDGAAGRSEFIKTLLEEAGASYEMKHEKIPERFKGGQWEGFPAFAVPLIQDGKLDLSATPVICRYLGKKHGLYPDNEDDQWHAEQLNSTVHDYFREGTQSFHGKNWIADYYTQVEETKPYIKFFLEERMPKFLQHFEKALCANNGGGGFMVGKKVTYLDLAMLHALRATESQFPEAWAAEKANIPLLVAFKERMSNRPRIKAYFESDRCLPFCGVSLM